MGSFMVYIAHSCHTKPEDVQKTIYPSYVGTVNKSDFSLYICLYHLSMVTWIPSRNGIGAHSSTHHSSCYLSDCISLFR